MKYKPRPGIVLTKLCDTNVLIPSRVAYDACKSIIRLPMLWAMTWSLLEKGEPEEKILRAHKILTKQSDSVIREKLNEFYEQLADQGYLIRVEDSE